jgi:Fe-Mn family superoxide dismutase
MNQYIINPIPKTNILLTNNFLSSKQNDAHYTGHYMKYINNLNELIKTNKDLISLYNMYNPNSNSNTRKSFLLKIITSTNENSKIYNNASQIFNHELYWNSLIQQEESIKILIDNKDKFFHNLQHFKKFYSDFIEKGISHFGSGWLWIYVNKDNMLDIITTHDAVVPINIDFFICIDLWEHAYYIDYEYKRKEYLQNIFKLINWNIILNNPNFNKN